MTLFYPDISSYDAGISLSGMAAVVVKATEGTTYTNPDYARVAAAARSRGIPWAAYHFLHHNSDPAAQARHYFAVAGGVPCMLDVETAGDGTKATVGDALTFANQLRALGGSVRLVYLPHWYWQALGSPDLRPLAAAGMGLVSSDYTTYSDTGPGWAAYGGMAPVVWQYTDAHALNGFGVDYNAYRGTTDQFRALLNGGAPSGGGVPDMEQADALQGFAAGGKRVADSLTDVLNLRMWMYAAPGGASPSPPPAGSVADLLLQAAERTLASVPQPVALTDADRAALVAAQPSAADVAAHIDLSALAALIAGHIKVQ